MKRKSIFKRGLTCLVLAALVAVLGGAPASVKAAVTPANDQSSVDGLNDAKITYSATIPTSKSEITINKTGKYQLIADVSKKADELGFWMNNQEVKVTYVDGTVGVFPVTWKTANGAKVKVSQNGTITGVAVSDKDEFGNYIPTKIYATIDKDAKFYDEEGVEWSFKNGVVYTEKVTVVPTEDLSVYFEGVWQEDYDDDDAQHYSDFAVRDSNVVAQLKLMAEGVAKHCVGTSCKLVAYTKTNDGTVRAYIATYNKDAGTHYYIMKYKTDADGINHIVVSGRDYCETKYTEYGRYVRAAK